MGLQVRLRHALGERVLELPDRAVDNPVIIGRAGDADVQIPSINVGQQHLVLFLHEGRWVVQDGPGSTGTAVNGERLGQPRVLGPGDVLRLGSEANAPTIEIDPGGMAATPYAASAVTPVYQYAEPAVPAAPPAGYVRVSRGFEPAYEAPAVVQEAHGEDVAASNGDEIAWGDQEPMRSSYSYRRRPRKSSEAAIAFAVLGVLAIVGTVVVVIYLSRQRAEREVAAADRARAEATAAAAAADRANAARVGVSKPRVTSVFKDPHTKPAVVPAPRGADAPPPPPDLTEEMPETSPATSDPDADSGPPTRDVPGAPRSTLSEDSPPTAGGSGSPEEEAFKRVQSAYYNPDPAKALLAFDVFEQDFPDARKKEIAQYREDMLDKIWWERIDSLFQKRKTLAAAIKDTEKKIKDESEEAYKKTVLEPLLADQKARLAKVGELLSKEMSYTLPDPPPIGKDNELAALRAKRDAFVYETWKKRTLKHIRDKHGQYPWANEGEIR